MSVPGPQSSDSSQTEVTRFKAEGNALFVKKDFSGAYEKYTLALKHDDKNAILYSNRAACSMSLNRYIDACTDATKATKLDPTYAKAWARLAVAHTHTNRLDQAVKAWKRAKDTLPVENLSPAEEKQRTEYTSEYTKAVKMLADWEANPMVVKGTPIQTDQSPWHRAIALIPQLTVQGIWCSSAWVIGAAYRDWEKAVTNMKLGHYIEDPRGRGYFGHKGVIEGLSNALIADHRVFHISESKFLQMYNDQMIFEVTTTKAWSNSGVREIMEQAPQRLKAEGWGSVRPALSLTVRAWVLRAYMEESLRGTMEMPLDLYTSALELLRWGQELWKNVPDEKRGAIFQSTFIRGIKCIHLDAMMKAHSKNPTVQSKPLLENLLAGANALLEELGEVPTTPNVGDFGFFLSFFRYPAGQAHSMRGYYFQHTGKLLHEASGSITPEVADLYTKAGHAYSKAATYYPEDDETHVWFLHCSVLNHVQVGAPAIYLLSLFDQIRKAIPQMKSIWELTGNRDIHGELEKDMKFRDKLFDAVESGQISDPENCIRLEWLENKGSL